MVRIALNRTRTGTLLTDAAPESLKAMPAGIFNRIDRGPAELPARAFGRLERAGFEGKNRAVSVHGGSHIIAARIIWYYRTNLLV
jgi:hypothetical protein